MPRITEDFEDLNEEAPDRDLEVDEEGSDDLFSATNADIQEIDPDDIAALEEEFRARMDDLRSKSGLSGEKGTSERLKGAKGDKGDKDFEWKPANTLDAPEPRPGMVQRWIRFMVGDAQDAKNWSRARREGWNPRSVDTVPKGFDAPTMNHGTIGTVIQVGDLILCEMDERLYRSRKKFFAKKAQRQKEAMEKKPINGTPIKVEERKQTTTYGRRRAVATDD